MSAPPDVVEAVRKSREAQGLPPHITDPLACQRAADILRPAPAKKAKRK